MKVILILAAVICASSAFTLKAEHQKIFETRLAQELARRFGGKGLLPALPDPLPVNDTRINFDELEQELADGWLEIAKCMAHGLSTVKDSFSLNALTMTLTGGLTAEKATIITDVKADAVIHLPISGESRTLKAEAGAHFEGTVELFELVDVSAHLKINLITDRATIDKLEAFVHFNGNIHVTGKAIFWAGLEVEWDAVNTDLPAFIDKLLAENHAEVIKIAKDILNLILKDIPISEIIG